MSQITSDNPEEDIPEPKKYIDQFPPSFGQQDVMPDE